jgi:hypothetical protein
MPGTRLFTVSFEAAETKETMGQYKKETVTSRCRELGFHCEGLGAGSKILEWKNKKGLPPFARPTGVRVRKIIE